MRKLILLTVVLGAAALPAVAAGQKYDDIVSIHSDSENYAEEVFGSVESQKAKCEKNRTIQLFYRQFNGSKRGPAFQQVDQTTTNSKGEYSFFAAKDNKRGLLTFDAGEYFARVLKKGARDDVCRKDDSPIMELYQPCSWKSGPAAKRGPILC